MRIGQFVGSMFNIRQSQCAKLTHHFVNELERNNNNNNNNHWYLLVNLWDAAMVEAAATSSTIVVVMVTEKSTNAFRDWITR